MVGAGLRKHASTSALKESECWICRPLLGVNNLNILPGFAFDSRRNFLTGLDLGFLVLCFYFVF